ncbi:MAG: ribonuclease III [Spirochaetales bacterium]|nr:ribonuclease III [Spirochaetales bacterium]
MLKYNSNFNEPPFDNERKKELKLFQQLSKIRFKSIKLLNLSFSHRSYANETPGDIDNNERLEFLGDSVLGLIVSEYLYHILEDKPEGDLAKIKSHVVSEEILASIAKRLRVDNYILIGKGEEYSGGRSKKTLLADALEAIIGAYYIDSGYIPVKAFVLENLIPEIDKVIQDKHQKDYKSLLQELVQKKFRTYPRYTIVSKMGPDHDRTFVIEVSINNKNYGKGKGKNKKEAEQQAAGVAYIALTEKKEKKPRKKPFSGNPAIS